MVVNCDSNYYSNKKGIYKDLYRTLNDEKSEKTFQNFRPRKGIYRDLYRNFEEDASTLKVQKLYQALRNFGKGFVSSVQSIFESPKEFVLGLGLVAAEWFLTTKKQFHAFSKLGKIAGIAQLALATSEAYKDKTESSCYHAGSAVSSIWFSNKFTGLLNAFNFVRPYVEHKSLDIKE